MINSYTLALQDGRTLGYGETGASAGHPVLFFHGTPSSRLNLSVLMLEKLIHANNYPVTLYSIDRPGYGLSDSMKGRTMKDWTEDIEEFLEKMEIQEFSILGVSGGVPYALSCAHDFGSRVHKTHAVSGIGPLSIKSLYEVLPSSEKDLLLASLHAPDKVNELAERIHDDPMAFIQKILANMPKEAKREIPEELIKAFEISLYESTYTGDGIVQDYRIYSQDWGIDLHDITTPVHFWHSDADENVPISHSEYLVERLPNGKLTTLRGLNHYMSMLTPMEDVMKNLLPEKI